LFTFTYGRRKIVGTVGQLQFEVLQYRLKHEYGAECRFEPLKFYKACWITSKNPVMFEDFCRFKADRLGYDKDKNLVFFAESEWSLNYFREKYPDIEFHFTSEFKKG
ncbi:MAG: peptide chain release factor 3, partial [Candidatus Firestonebacteria bacterium]